MIVKVEDNRTLSVNPDTGEILGEYVASESTEKEISKEDKHNTDSLLNPYTARSVDDIESYIGATVDGRKLITINNTRHYHDINCGEMVRNGAKNQFTLPAYKLMSRLVGALTIHNCIICTKGDLSLLLDCDVSKIKRTLKACGSLVEYVGSKGMQKGFVKVFINPAYGWKGEYTTAYTSQQKAIDDWYKSAEGSEGDALVYAIDKPFEISEDFDKWLTSFAKGVKPFKDNVYEEQAEAYFFKGDKK